MLKDIFNPQEIIQQQIHSSWNNLLLPLSSMYLKTMIKVMNNYSGSAYDSGIMYPNTNEVLKPFRQTTNDKLKVLMVFEEPYNNGEATGLPLELDEYHKPLSERNRHQQSIEVFNKLLDKDVKIIDWCNQGVLLCNLSLTSEHNKLNKHLTLWNDFSETLLSQLIFDNPNLIIVTFSSNIAFTIKKCLSTVRVDRLIYNSPPAYNTEYSYKEFKEYNVLNKLDMLLKTKNKIQW